MLNNQPEIKTSKYTPEINQLRQAMAMVAEKICALNPEYAYLKGRLDYLLEQHKKEVKTE